jgi:hypothetical protein
MTLREKYDKRMKPGTKRRDYWREYKRLKKFLKSKIEKGETIYAGLGE